jgi:hypothetical protein
MTAYTHSLHIIKIETGYLVVNHTTHGAKQEAYGTLSEALGRADVLFKEAEAQILAVQAEQARIVAEADARIAAEAAAELRKVA